MSTTHKTLGALAALLSGAVFGLGLSVAGMTNPDKVLNFLDVSGRWDASLLFVLGSAVVVFAVAYRLIARAQAPLLDTSFHLPTLTRVDRPLIAGSVIFGIGWGMAGYCPGPAVASLGFANPEALWILPSMLAGVWLHQFASARAAVAAVEEDDE